jgi:signal transduction histidine kinase
VTQANAPLKDVMPVLVEDDQGYIWVSIDTGSALIRFHPGEVDKLAANPSHHLEYAMYDETDGMRQGTLTWQSGVGGVRGPDGRLWLATGPGITIVDPRNLPQPRRPAAPRIHTITADGRTVSPSRGLSLPNGTSTLLIEYGTVSLSSASKLRYRYMIDGLDEDWVYAGHGREASYSNLPSGDHRFRVSTTHDGQWTEATVWDFAVDPPFYLRRLFLIVVAGLVAMTLALAWWLRLRAVTNQYALVLAERARVSREIHDTLLQSLAAIGVELETIATQLDVTQNPARDPLRRLRRQVGHCLREARESIIELRHNTMKPRALIDSLRELAENTTKTKNVATNFTASGRPRPCSADADIQLFRIGQEAVNNAIRHGRATQIDIALAYEQDRVILKVADDGCGFTPDEHDPAPAVGEHLGLLNMKERAARVRGRLSIFSTPGRGTTIETAIPITAE